MTEAAVQPEETPAEAPVAEPKVEIVKEYVYDTGPIDASITTLKKTIEHMEVDSPQFIAISSQIDALESQKKEAASKADIAKLRDYERKDFEQTLFRILPAGIDPSVVPGNTNEERLRAAQAISEAISATQKSEEEIQKMVEEEAKKKAQEIWGGNLVPSGPAAPAGEDDIAALTKAMEEGRPEDVMRNPAFRQKYDKVPTGGTPAPR